MQPNFYIYSPEDKLKISGKAIVMSYSKKQKECQCIYCNENEPIIKSGWSNYDLSDLDMFFFSNEYNRSDKKYEIALIYECTKCYSFFSKNFEMSVCELYDLVTPEEVNEYFDNEVIFNFNEISIEKILKRQNFNTRKYYLLQDISPDSLKIYYQANLAENIGLTEIAGIAYRKFLEFFIKDFCISENPDKKNIIEKMFLGKVIDKYLNNYPELQAFSKAGTWLGNDETHYVRKHIDKDLTEMKDYIESIFNFLSLKAEYEYTSKFISESSHSD